MALQKDKEVESGAVGNYWRITSLSLDRVKNTLLVRVSLYLTKASRDSLKTSLESQSHTFDTLTPQELAMDIVELCYLRLKTLDYFADAVDC